MEHPNRRRTARVVVYPKDVENITGLKKSAASKLLQRIHVKFQKLPHQYVTIPEFCAYTGIDEQLVKDYFSE